MKRRVLLIVALVLVVLAIAAAGTFYWATRSESALRFAIEQAAQRLPGKLTAEGITGSITDPVRIQRVRYVHDATTIEALDVRVDFSPWELGRNNRVHIRELHLRELTVSVPQLNTKSASAEPNDLSLPLPVQIDRLLIDQLRVTKATNTFTANTVRLAYVGDRNRHHVTLENLTFSHGQLSATAELAAHKPFALGAQGDFRGEAMPAWPAAAHIDLQGSLSEIAFKARGELRAMPVSASAQLAPLADVPLRTFAVQATAIDLQKLIDHAPHTQIEAAYAGKATSVSQLTGELSLKNLAAGTLDSGGVPVQSLSGTFQVSAAALKLSSGVLDLGKAGKGTLQAGMANDVIEAQFDTARLDLAGVHSALRPTHLSGKVSAQLARDGQQYRGTLAQDNMQLTFKASQHGEQLIVESAHAQAGSASVDATCTLELASPNAVRAHGQLSRFNPAAFGRFPIASINGRFDVEATLRPQWRAAIAYRIERSSYRNAPLSGDGRFEADAHALRGIDARLTLGTNKAVLSGAFGAPGNKLHVRLDAPALSVLGEPWSGSIKGEGDVLGTYAQPGVDLDATARELTLPGGYRARTVQVRGRWPPNAGATFDVDARAEGLEGFGQRLDKAQVRGTGSVAQHRLEVHVVRTGTDVSATAQGGYDPQSQTWSGRLLTLDSGGDYVARLAQPVPISLARDRIVVNAATIELKAGRIQISELRYARGALVASGDVTGLPLAKVLGLAQAPPQLQTTLVVGGRWRIDAGAHVNGHLELQRESGDISIVADEERLALELTQLALNADAASDALSAEVRIEGKRLGRVHASAKTRLSQRNGRWGVAGTAPLSVSAHGEVLTLKPIAALNKSITADGRLTLEVSGVGTVAHPNLRGRLEAQQLSLEQVENGVLLQNGSAHAAFDERGVDLKDFSIASSTGKLEAKGRIAAPEGRLDARIDWTADQLAAVQRPDLALTITGAGTVAYRNERSSIAGRLRVDHGRVEVKSGGAPTLDDDVVVVGAKPGSSPRAQLLHGAVDFDLDLGPDFKVTGSGLDARIEGKLHLTSPGQELAAGGEITIARGTYEAYGRKLDIDKGTLYFNGPVLNPGLNIRAMRKNQQVEAGVEVTGTARAPVVRLVSNPEVPDQEKLAWLVLGHKVDSAQHSDTQALQSSAALLLADVGTGSLQKQLAQRLKLDELSVSGGQAGTSTGGVVTLGKRISERIYVIFERGLGAASNAVKVNYQLSRRWSLRTESGRTDAVDIFYSISWD